MLLQDLATIDALLRAVDERAEECRPEDVRTMAREMRAFVEAVGTALIDIGAEKIASDALIEENKRLAAEVSTARADEREACAAICEKAAVEASSIGALAGISASWAAESIRARGER